jgi:Tol biopolymer transport system component
VLFWDGQGVNSPSTLFVARANGSARHALARVEGYEHEAAWAPGSRRLAYVGTDGVHVVGADGSGDRLVGAGRFASSPAWSSDGRSLAFVLEGTLTVVRGPVRRALGRGGPFSWSPNGGRIVYATQEGLVVERADGRDRWLLVPASEVSELAWSADGRFVAYRASGVRVVEVATGAARIIDDANVSGALAWSPTGHVLAFVWDRGVDDRHTIGEGAHCRVGTGRRRRPDPQLRVDAAAGRCQVSRPGA